VDASQIVEKEELIAKVGVINMCVLKQFDHSQSIEKHSWIP